MPPFRLHHLWLHQIARGGQEVKGSVIRVDDSQATLLLLLVVLDAHLYLIIGGLRLVRLTRLVRARNQRPNTTHAARFRH